MLDRIHEDELNFILGSISNGADSMMEWFFLFSIDTRVLLSERFVVFSKRINESRRGIATSRLATAKLYLASI